MYIVPPAVNTLLVLSHVRFAESLRLPATPIPILPDVSKTLAVSAPADTFKSTVAVSVILVIKSAGKLIAVSEAEVNLPSASTVIITALLPEP